MRNASIRLCGALAAAMALVSPTFGQAISVPSTFTYQGYLKVDGAAVNTAQDFQLRLCPDGSCSGTPSSYVTVGDVMVTNGEFTLVLDADDFQIDAFHRGLDWLEIGVRPGDSLPGDSYTLLLPRVPLTATPYAQSSGSVTDVLWWPGYPPIDIDGSSAATAVFVRSIDFGFSGPLVDCILAGSGDTYRSTTTGSGTGFHGLATGTGRAARFEMTNVANTNTAVEITTAGSGSAVRAFSASGIGLLAESTSSVGLQASSSTGTALDVMGSSAFSGTAAFNNMTPFSVPIGSGEIANLNAANSGRLNGNLASFYQNAGNLNAGVLLDVRLSSNVARLGTAQIFTAAKTFSAAAPATFNALATFNAAAEASSIHVTGAVTRDFSGSPANAGPLAYGFINAAGGVSANTANVTVALVGMNYEITIAGENYQDASYVTTVTVNTSAMPVPVAATSAAGGKLIVKLFAQMSQTTGAFQFVTYKP